jgi:hypothetical protein
VLLLLLKMGKQGMVDGEVQDVASRGAYIARYVHSAGVEMRRELATLTVSGGGGLGPLVGCLGVRRVRG